MLFAWGLHFNQMVHNTDVKQLGVYLRKMASHPHDLYLLHLDEVSDHLTEFFGLNNLIQTTLPLFFSDHRAYSVEVIKNHNNALFFTETEITQSFFVLHI